MRTWLGCAVVVLAGCGPKKAPEATADRPDEGAAASASAAPIEVPCEWDTGFGVDYELVRTRSVAGVVDWEVRSTVRVEAIQGADWRYDVGATEIVTPGSIPMNPVASIAGRFDGDAAPVDLVFTEAGAIEIVDLGAHVERMHAQIEDMDAPPGVTQS